MAVAMADGVIPIMVVTVAGAFLLALVMAAAGAGALVGVTLITATDGVTHTMAMAGVIHTTDTDMEEVTMVTAAITATQDLQLTILAEETAITAIAGLRTEVRLMLTAETQHTAAGMLTLQTAGL